MFIRLFQFKIRQEEVDNLKKFYLTTAYPRFEKQQGCLYAALISGEPDNFEFVSVTFWDSYQSAENFERSNVFKELLIQIRPMLSDSSEWQLQLSDKTELEYVPVPEEPVIKKYDVKYRNSKEDNIPLKSDNMFIRIVSLNIMGNKFDEFKEIFFQKILPELKATEGCKHVFLTENINDKNEFLSVSIWENKPYAEQYEKSGKYKDLLKLLKGTLSHYILWKMTLHDEFSKRVKTSNDIKIDSFNFLSGRN